MDYMMLLWLPTVLYLLFAGNPVHLSLWMSREIDTGSSEVCTHDRVVGSAGSPSGTFQTSHLTYLVSHYPSRIYKAYSVHRTMQTTGFAVSPS